MKSGRRISDMLKRLPMEQEIAVRVLLTDMGIIDPCFCDLEDSVLMTKIRSAIAKCRGIPINQQEKYGLSSIRHRNQTALR